MLKLGFRMLKTTHYQKSKEVSKIPKRAEFLAVISAKIRSALTQGAPGVQFPPFLKPYRKALSHPDWPREEMYKAALNSYLGASPPSPHPATGGLNKPLINSRTFS